MRWAMTHWTARSTCSFLVAGPRCGFYISIAADFAFGESNSGNMLKIFKFFTVGIFLSCLAAAQAVYAQTRFAIQDTPNVNWVSASPGEPSYEGYYPGQTTGTISSNKTWDGYTILEFCDYIAGGKVGAYQRTILKIGGFTGDPGKSWLNNAQVNGVTFIGSSASTYSYSSGSATWTFGGGPAFDKANPAATVITHNGNGADVGLRWLIVGVNYAPPGQHSDVNYNNSTMQGTNTTTANSWNSNTTYSVSVKVSGGIPGIEGGSITGETSTSYGQEQDANTGIAVSTSTTYTDVIDGPASSSVGVDHDYDVIWVWLNPQTSYVLGQNEIALTGYSFNAQDGTEEMEVVPLYVSWLKNPSSIPANVASRLARTWDTSGLGGFTANDYAQILSSDPFATTGYNPSSDTGHRFDLVGGQTFSYSPPPAGGQPVTQNFSVTTSTTSTSGQGASSSHSTSWKVTYTNSTTVLEAATTITGMLSVGNTMTTTDKWSSTINSQSGKAASFSITGPATADNYTGPTVMQVWRDNVYGSFMFNPVQ